MFKKAFARCPYGGCGYVWVLRIPDQMPKMCPLCKRRFKNPDGPSPKWAAKPVETWTEEFETYDQVRKRLKELYPKQKSK